MKKQILHPICFSSLLCAIVFSQMNARPLNPMPACQAAFSIAVSGNQVYVVNNSTGTTSNTVYTWDFGGLTNATNPNPVFTNLKPGSYTVCLTIDDPNGCHSKECKQVSVRSLCTAAYGYISDSATNTYFFTNISKGTLKTATYLWEFGDGSTSSEKNPIHKYQQPGNYNVCLYVNDSTSICASNFCQPVNFHSTVNHFGTLKGESSTLPDLITSDLLSNKHNISINPNPFNSFSTIQYQLAKNTNVTIGVYDFTGNRINLIVSENESEGPHSHIIRSDNLNSGFYFIKMMVGEESFTKRISVLK